jgi:hypothetical protein
VVRLVLEAAGQVAGADDLHGVAVVGEATGDDVLPANRVDVDTGHGQAALRAVLLLVVREVEHRVDQRALDPVHVEGEHPQADPELRGGQAGALLVMERVVQVADQPAQLGVEGHHWVGWGGQHRVAEQADRQDGHRSPPTRHAATFDRGLAKHHSLQSGGRDAVGAAA